ncbi:DnaJ domain-containing protein [Mycoplasmopsis caviae]|uniref:Chaperone protein DnaJ n=1 Tax=Mycoplasmopsis caviae TaxID=55603 RepID=A0A3P8K9D4_9BACT|nr:DnaJ C-terminal domain-containing protein [Mycoplasmopsis caviae]UUD35216.1 DnaJ domain-containing protein [Mycoplasmopsis caviae]VDR41999.1 chaperone protein [Mycoplasmopsis caviae]
MPKKSYYEVLGVPKTASEKEIKSAYRKLAMKYHPDKLKDGTSDQKMQELNEAYEVLSDPNKKSNYDRFGSPDGPQPGQGFGMNFNAGMGDFRKFTQNIFDTVFNFGDSGRSSKQKSAKVEKIRGDDIYTEIIVDFIEAIKGKEFKEKLNKFEICGKCKGTGADNPSDIKTCNGCQGKGQKETQTRSVLGYMKMITTCDRCNGSGKLTGKTCRECNGSLYTKKLKNVTFKIPEGSDTGDKIKIDGYGEKGHNGGESGDLYIVIIVKEHKYFKRSGLDLFLDLPVSFLDIVKENSVMVPTPYGFERIKMKNTYQFGKILNLTGKGVRSKRGVGNMKVSLQILMPNFTTDLYNEMAKILEPYEDNVNAEFSEMVKKER